MSLSAKGILEASRADYFVVAGDDVAYLVEATAPGITIGELPGIDRSREIADVTFRDVPCERLDGASPESVMRARAAAAIALSAECVGIGAFALDAPVSYAQQREQFGRAIGTYQAVAHSCARMYRDVENARSAVLYAAWVVDHDFAAAQLPTAMATAYALELAHTAPEAALQIFGGVGFSWEHHLHLWLKRGRTNAVIGGGAKAARLRVSALIGVPSA